MKNEIKRHRKEIDRIDSKILELLNKRARYVIEIGKIKKGAKAEFHSPERERKIYERLEGENKGPFPQEGVRAVFREIMSASLSLEQRLRVAYLGPKATFTHLACMQQFGDSAQYLPASSIKEVFNEVEKGEAEYGVVPIENSTEGIVSSTLDIFVDSDVKIVGEILLEVSHNLMSKSGRMEDIKKIYSHPQPAAQCRIWLENNLPDIPITEVSSSAKAAEISAEDLQAGAIASELAAKIYGLKIAKKRIEDNIHNFTRFLIIGKKSLPRSGKDKTSIMFSVKDEVGALFNMLKPFSESRINLTKIESRPSRKRAWEYIFYVDMDGHIEEDRVKRALNNLEKRSLFLKILGSYPAAGNLSALSGRQAGDKARRGKG